MNREQNFDNDFKDKIDQMEFEFKESYWNEMESLLDSKKKKRGAFFWWITSLSVASVLIAGVVVLLTTTNQPEHLQAGKTEQKLQSSTQGNESEVGQADNHELNGMSQESSEESNVLGDSKSTNRAEKIQQQSNDNKSSNLVKREATQKVTSPKNEGTKNGYKTNSKKEQIASGETNAIHDNSYLNVQNPELPNVENHFSKMEINQNVMLPTEQRNLTLPNFKVAKKPAWNSHVGVLAGINFGQSFRTDQGSVGGFGSQMGLRFYFDHKSGLQLNTGLVFGVNSIDGLVYEETAKVFGFAQYDLVNTIQYKRMLTAHVPLYIGYDSYRFSVAGGLRLNYIMNTQGKVYTWDNSVVDQNIWGYAHGIKYFNLACGLESSYRISRRFDLGLSLDLDLSSRSQENNELVSPEARLWQAGMFIKYRLN